MGLDGLAPDEVLAMRYDESAVAEELAAWCGGKVERTMREDGTVGVVVWVPTPKGPRPALPGDWIVRRGPDEHTVMDAEAFAANHGPA